MRLLALILRNALRHRLRSLLTVAGVVVAITAFGLLRTVVDAWYAGAEGTSTARLITRNAISLVFPLPLTYAERIRRVPGVARVSWSNWFGGVYVSERNFFPQFAVDARSYFELYPEFVIAPEQLKAFARDRTGAVVGRKLAQTYGWKLGDSVPLRGTIYPGTWTFTVRAIYDGATERTDTSQFFLRWDYLNESVRRLAARRADQVGVYIVGLEEPGRAAEVSRAVDETFRNSLAETLTETEKAFQLSFVAMTEAILTAIEVVSLVVIVIIMAVMANTMAMTARERTTEYATLKALGFRGGFITALIAGESLALALVGGALGIALTFPLAGAFARAVGSLLPVFVVSAETLALQIGAAVLVGLVAAVLPAWRAARLPIVDGLRSVG